MELIQRPELRQKVTLSPQVYQGLTILAMPITDLAQLIEAQLLENPVLELEEDDPERDEFEEHESESSSSEEERAWDEWLDEMDELDRVEERQASDPDAEAVLADEFVGGPVSFTDYLLEQIGMLDLAPDVARAARIIVGYLDEDGFFTGELREVATLAGVDADVAAEALRAVQQLDPLGVGARDVREALHIQVHHLGLESPLLGAIIDRHLDDVAKNRIARIARAERAYEQDVRCAIETLKTLNPRPAGAYSPGVTPAYVVPDVTVRRFGDEWVVIPNTDALPTLHVSPRYRQMLRSTSGVDEETRRYLKEKVRQAESFMRNLDRRKDTVSRIAEIIVASQPEFFEDGRGALRPLKLEDVAAELGVHLSTVSRGVTGKYMATPYGLFELKHFFSGGYRTATGMDVAATTVKQRVKQLLLEEDPAHPLSDQRIAEILAEEGIDVARRTVAKYREEMGIQPSWARKHRS